MSAELPVIPNLSVSGEPAEIEKMTNAALAKMPEIGDARYLGVVRGNQFTTPQYTEHFKDYLIETAVANNSKKQIFADFAYGNAGIVKEYINTLLKNTNEIEGYVNKYLDKYGISPYIDFEGDFEEPFKVYIKSYIKCQLQGRTDVTDKHYLSVLETLPITTTDNPKKPLNTLLDKLYYLRGEYLVDNEKVPLAPANPARAQAQASARAQQATATSQAAAKHHDIPLDPIPHIVSGEKKELSDYETQYIMNKLKKEVTEIYDKFDDLFIKFSLNNSLTGETKQVFDDVIEKMKQLAEPPGAGDIATVKAEKELKFGNYLSIMRQVKSFYPELYDKVETAMKQAQPRLSVAIPNKNNVGNPNAATPNSKWSPGSQTLGSPNTPGFRPGSALPSPLQSPGSPQPPPKGGKGSKRISSRFKPQIV
jgi:hypothetical protein